MRFKVGDIIESADMRFRVIGHTNNNKIMEIHSFTDGMVYSSHIDFNNRFKLISEPKYKDFLSLLEDI